MALWNFTAALVPAEAIGERVRFTVAEFDEAEPSLWAARKNKEEVVTALSALLRPMSSWSEKLSQWGVDHGDRVEVWREEGDVQMVYVKVDCRTPNIDFIESVERIAHSHALRLVYSRTLEVCAPADGAFHRFILSSANRRWLEDPKTWLPHMASEVKKREENA